MSQNVQITPDLFVMHTCDNPPCCNPRHLKLGTNADNMADMVQKGRAKSCGLRGEDIGNSKLDELSVSEIRRSADTGIALADRYGVSRATISLIRNGKLWRHLLPPAN